MAADLAPIVWFAGVNWDAVNGTDKRLVSEIAKVRPVIWIDPAHKDAWPGWLNGAPPAVTQLEGVTRFRVPATLGVTRPPVRGLTAVLRELTVRRAVSSENVHACVVSSPIISLPRYGTRRILYVTDDWPAGAELMGLNPRWIARILERNVRRADAIAAVSPLILDKISASIRKDVLSEVLPNGAPSVALPEGSPRSAIAGLIGQVNERIDLSLMQATVDAGIRLKIVGPRAIRDKEFAKDFDRLVASPLVDWLGAVPAGDVAAHLADIAVGLTPYTHSAFNLASSPLKTFEYLAAGIPVVSSDIPASRWLATPHVIACSDAATFVAEVQRAIDGRDDTAIEDSRRALAGRHSWAVRAASMLDLIDSAGARE